MKKASIYIETSIISYLTARPSRDLMIAASQQITAEWWESSRESYEVVTSDLVVLESREGDPRTAQRRLDLLTGHTIDYLLTWNLRHIDNPAIRPRVREICGLKGYHCPEICTPFEIMELR